MDTRHSKSIDRLPPDVTALGDFLARLPAPWRDESEPLYARVVELTRKRRRLLTLLQDALSQLRLDMKYLLFDLEATRRERDALRRMRDED